MKAYITLILLASIISVIATPEKIESLTTLKGKTYTSVIVSKHTPYALHFIHSSGAAAIPFNQLSKEIQDQYSYDPLKAAEYKKKDNIADAKRRAQRAREQIILDERKAERKAQEKQNRAKKAEETDKKNSILKRRSGKLDMVAKTESTSTKKGRWGDTWGAVDQSGAVIVAESGKKKVSRRVVGVHLSCPRDSHGGNYVVEMFWFGFPLDKKSKRYVCAAAIKKISVPARGTKSIAIASDYNYTDQSLLYLESDPNYETWKGLYVRKWSGYTYAGWVVRVSDGNGRIIAQQGAQPSFIRHIQKIPLPRTKK